MVSESRVTWATSVPILVFLGLSILELGPIYATDKQTLDAADKRQTKAPLRPIEAEAFVESADEVR